MGMDGVMPPLQLGGVQETVIALLPTAGEVTLAVPPKTVLLAPVTPTETGLLVFQVRETPVSDIPTLSVTVAFRVVVVPTLTLKEIEVGGLLAAASEMDCTGQVLKLRG